MPKLPTDNADKDGRPRKTVKRSSPGKTSLIIGTGVRHSGAAICRESGRETVDSYFGANSVRKQFTVKKPNDEQEYAWTVNIKSPLYRDLLGFLPNEITGKFPTEISGKRVPSCSASYAPEKDEPTRYTVKAA